MIVYVDLEHERRQRDDPERSLQGMANRLKIKYRLEDISGEPCLIIRYHQVTPEKLRALAIKAVVVSGNATEFIHYSTESLAGLRAVLREGAYPTLAFCGGCQILAQSYGAAIGPIGPLPPGVDDPQADQKLAPGMIQERGFHPVRVVQPHPLFDGLGEQPVFFQSHYWEVKAPPPGFQLYASSDKCQVQLIAHHAKPIFATQFHPELYADDHLDGRRLLENFFRSV
jgi:GMP synthase (glutamine-hydrolysing)